MNSLWKRLPPTARITKPILAASGLSFLAYSFYDMKVQAEKTKLARGVVGRISMEDAASRE